MVRLLARAQLSKNCVDAGPPRRLVFACPSIIAESGVGIHLYISDLLLLIRYCLTVFCLAEFGDVF